RLQLRRLAVCDRGSLLARRRAAGRGPIRCGHLYRGVPTPRVAVRPHVRSAQDSSGLPARADLPGEDRGRNRQAGDPVDMATPETTTKYTPSPERPAEERELAGINADYKEKFGFHDPESGYAYKAPKGLSREVVESISEYKDEPEWMRDFRLKALEHFLER